MRARLVGRPDLAYLRVLNPGNPAVVAPQLAVREREPVLRLRAAAQQHVSSARTRLEYDDRGDVVEREHRARFAAEHPAVIELRLTPAVANALGFRERTFEQVPRQLHRQRPREGNALLSRGARPFAMTREIFGAGVL